jgi:TrmH family RNA methyltransferase
MLKEILSSKNTLIKETKKLQQKKYRQQTQSYLLEGFHLIQEAKAADVILKEVFISQRGLKEWSEWIEEKLTDYYLVSDEVLKTLASQPTPQGIIAVAEMPQECSGPRECWYHDSDCGCGWLYWCHFRQRQC